MFSGNQHDWTCSAFRMVTLEEKSGTAHYLQMRPHTHLHGPPRRSSSSAKREKVPLTLTKLISWAQQISSGMEYLSSKKVLHGDLACRNILLASNNVVKISDFGLARNIYGKSYYKKESRTPMPIRWMALESLIDGKFTSKSDVWSYGVVLWELFSLGEMPYAEVDINHVQSAVMNGLRLNRPELAPTEIFDIMLECWKHDPEARPGFGEVKTKMSSLLEQDRQGLVMTPTLPPQPRSDFIRGSTASFSGSSANNMMTNQFYFAPTPAEGIASGFPVGHSSNGETVGYLPLIPQSPAVSPTVTLDRQGYLMPTSPLPTIQLQQPPQSHPNQRESNSMSIQRQFSLPPPQQQPTSV